MVTTNYMRRNFFKKKIAIFAFSTFFSRRSPRFLTLFFIQIVIIMIRIRPFLLLLAFSIIFIEDSISQSCKTYTLASPTNYCPNDTDANNTNPTPFVLRLKTKKNGITKIYTWNLANSENTIKISPCLAILKFATDTRTTLEGGLDGGAICANGGPEDVVVSGDLSQTSRENFTSSNVLGVRSSECQTYNPNNKNWTYYKYLPNFKIKRTNLQCTTTTLEIMPDREIHPLAIGIGANLRDLNTMGGYGKFLMSDSSELELIFSLVETGPCNIVCPDCIKLNKNIGETCDDNNPNTINDKVQSDCTCKGTPKPKDCVTLDKNIGDSCNDNNPNTINDKVIGDCICQGTPKPKDCALLNKNIGDACDDDNPNTINDKVTSDCKCKGELKNATPLTIKCPTDIVRTIANDTGCVVVNWAEPIVKDETESVVTVSSNIKNGSCFPVGTTIVAYNAKNAKGNTANCSFYVSVNSTARSERERCGTYSLGNVRACDTCPFYVFKQGTKTRKVGNGFNVVLTIDSNKVIIKSSLRDSLGNVIIVIQSEDLDIACNLSQTARENVILGTGNIANKNWLYFNKVDNIRPDIASVILPLQIGIGANLVNPNSLGGLAIFKLKNGDTLELRFLLNTLYTSPCNFKANILNCPKNIEVTTACNECLNVKWQEPTVSDPNTVLSTASQFKNGDCFPIGTTPIIYKVKDGSTTIDSCSFNVTVKLRGIEPQTCTEYTVENTNEICNPQSWRPYALKIGEEIYKADKVIFQKQGDSATVRGLFRTFNWQSVVINLQLKDLVKNEPSFIVGNCISAAISSDKWDFYKTWAGTIQIGNAAPINIKGIKSFQVGKGANTQNVNELGGAGQFILSGKSSVFNFKLTNPSICGTSNLSSPRDILEAMGTVDGSKSRIQWIENQSKEGDKFMIEKLIDSQFETIKTVDAVTKEGLRQYTAFDEKPEEGENIYRVTLLKKNLQEKNSSLIPLSFQKINYINISPNPTDSDISIQFEKAPEQDITTYLYDMQGFEVKQVSFTKNGKSSFSMDIHGLQTGAYMIRVSQKGKRDFTKTVIIQK
jgi:HYR domain/Secretion system C-terminal sorting domain